MSSCTWQSLVCRRACLRSAVTPFFWEMTSGGILYSAAFGLTVATGCVSLQRRWLVLLVMMLSAGPPLGLHISLGTSCPRCRWQLCSILLGLCHEEQFLLSSLMPRSISCPRCRWHCGIMLGSCHEEQFFIADAKEFFVSSLTVAVCGIMLGSCHEVQFLVSLPMPRRFDSGHMFTSVCIGFGCISCYVKVDSDLDCRCATTGARFLVYGCRTLHDFSGGVMSSAACGFSWSSCPGNWLLQHIANFILVCLKSWFTWGEGGCIYLDTCRCRPALGFPVAQRHIPIVKTI